MASLLVVFVLHAVAQKPTVASARDLFSSTDSLQIEHLDYEALMQASENYFRQQLPDKGEQCLKQAIAKEPKRKDAYISLARFLRWQGKADESIKYYDKAIALTDKKDVNLINEKAVALIDGGDIHAGTKVLADLYKKTKAAIYLYQAAIAYTQADMMDEADKTIKKLEEATTKDAKLVLLARVKGYEKQGKFDQMRETAARLYELDKKDYDASLIYAQALSLAKQPQKAQEVLREVLRIRPEDKTVFVTLRTMYEQQGDRQSSDSLMTQYLKNPQISQEFKAFMLAELYQSKEQDAQNADKILKYAHLALDNTPSKNLLMQTTLFIMHQSGRTDSDIIDKAIQTLSATPEDQNLSEMIQQILINKTDAERLERLQSLSHVTLQPQARLVIAFIQYKKKQVDQAIQNIKQVITEEKEIKDNPELTGLMYYAYASMLIEKKDTVQALAAYANSLDYYYDMTVANDYAYFLHLTKKDPKKAQQLIEQVIRTGTNEPAYLDTYACILKDNKEYTKAKEYIDLALIALNDKNESAGIYENAGDIYALNGMTKEAVKYWKQALKKGGDKKRIGLKIKRKTIK